MHTNNAPPELRMRAALLGKPVASARPFKGNPYDYASCFTCSWLINHDGTHCRKHPQDPDPTVNTLMQQICADWTP